MKINELTSLKHHIKSVFTTLHRCSSPMAPGPGKQSIPQLFFARAHTHTHAHTHTRTRTRTHRKFVPSVEYICYRIRPPSRRGVRPGLMRSRPTPRGPPGSAPWHHDVSPRLSGSLLWPAYKGNLIGQHKYPMCYSPDPLAGTTCSKRWSSEGEFKFTLPENDNNRLTSFLLLL